MNTCNILTGLASGGVWYHERVWMFRFRALSKGSSGEAEVRSGYRLLMVGMRGAEGRRGSEVEV